MIKDTSIEPYLEFCEITRDLDNESAIGPMWKKSSLKSLVFENYYFLVFNFSLKPTLLFQTFQVYGRVANRCDGIWIIFGMKNDVFFVSTAIVMVLNCYHKNY